jgi:two-component system sensor kinase FixL
MGQTTDSEAKLQAIIETAVDAIVVINDHGIIETVNASCQRLFGYTSSELLGHNVSRLMPSPDREMHDSYLQKYLHTGKKKIIGIGREVTAKRKDGTLFPVNLAVSEVRLQDRVLFTGFIRDLTDRKKAEDALRASEERYRSLVQTAGISIMCLSPDLRILEMNAQAERIHGCRRNEALGKYYVNHFIPEEYRNHVVDEMKGVLAGKPTQGFENPIRVKGGDEIILLWNSSPLQDGESRITGLIVCGQDITEFKNLMRGMMEKSSLARLGEMAAVVAHEVKNPLAAISGTVQVLQSKFDPSSQESRVISELLDRIEAMDRSVQDLLTYGRPRSPRFAAVRLLYALQESASLVEQDPTFPDIKIAISGPDVTIRGDQDLLKQVFLNLLLNAAHANSGRGEIKTVVEETSKQCRIFISDSGPGIEPEILKKIFEPFFTTKTRGTGLGLPIAQRMVDLHEGSISVATPVNEGTTFIVTLPLLSS